MSVKITYSYIYAVESTCLIIYTGLPNTHNPAAYVQKFFHIQKVNLHFICRFIFHQLGPKKSVAFHFNQELRNYTFQMHF